MKKQVVHLRVYRGRDLTYNKKGEITTENWVVKLIYGIPEWHTFLSMLRPNGYCEVSVENVKVDVDGEWEDVKDFSNITNEVETAFSIPLEKLSPEQQRIADLEEKLSKMERMMKSTYVEPKSSVPNKLDDSNKKVEQVVSEKLDDIEQLREQYLKVSGEKAHHLWKAERIKQEIEAKS